MKISKKNKCFGTLKKKSEKINGLKKSIANWKKTIDNYYKDSRYLCGKKAKDKRDCLSAGIGAMNEQKQGLKQLKKK